jgi:hypothetical protein
MIYNMHIYIYTHTHTQTRDIQHAYTYIYIHTHTHARAHTHTPTHTHNIQGNRMYTMDQPEFAAFLDHQGILGTRFSKVIENYLSPRHMQRKFSSQIYPPPPPPPPHTHTHIGTCSGIFLRSQGSADLWTAEKGRTCSLTRMCSLTATVLLTDGQRRKVN